MVAAARKALKFRRALPSTLLMYPQTSRGGPTDAAGAPLDRVTSDPLGALQAALAEVVAKGAFDVPPYPAVALRLQRILARPNHSLAEVAATVASDPALAARVLGVVNSAAYGASQEITNIGRAVNRLGSRTISALAVAAGIGASTMQAGVLFDVKYRVWRRTITCALACQKLSPLHSLDQNDAFLVGLLHGFGRSLAVAALEKIITTERPARPLGVADWLALAEHARGKLTAAVALRWALPESLVEPLKENGAPPAWHELLGRANHIAVLLETGQTLEGRSAAESRALEEFVHGLPAALDALTEVPPGPALRSPAVLAKPERVLDGSRRACAVALADRRKKSPLSLRCLSVTPDGIEFESPSPCQESSMMRVAVGAGTEVFEPWLNVVLCVPAGSAFRVEAQLMSPTREVKQRWHALWTSAQASS